MFRNSGNFQFCVSVLLRWGPRRCLSEPVRGFWCIQFNWIILDLAHLGTQYLRVAAKLLSASEYFVCTLKLEVRASRDQASLVFFCASGNRSDHFCQRQRMSGPEFAPNWPPKRRPTITLSAPAELVGDNIAYVTRFPSGTSVPSLGLQQHQVLEWICALPFASRMIFMHF